MIDISITTPNINSFKVALPTSFILSRKALDDISEIIRVDNEQNVIDGTGLDGAGFKTKEYGNNRRLFVSGDLSRSIKRKTFITEAHVFISSPADKYAGFVNKIYPFFGIANRALLKIDKYLIVGNQNELFDKRFK